MRDLNKVTLMGNLTRDPEVRTTPNGQTVTSFSLALNRSWNDQQGARQDAVEYIDVVAWGKLGEIVGQYLAKGRRAYIEGRLQTRNWEAQDGSKRYKTEVVASDLIMLDRASDNPGGSAPRSQEPVAQVSGAQNSPVETDEISIEDIPF
ncbi:MAG: single-stranded DNA-binding protein [Patescibacteria group bacterium]